MTEFALGDYLEAATEEPPPVPPTPTDPDEVEKEDDDDYEYIFWGCMNAFYICLILWFWYIILALVCRKLDMGSDD